MITRINRIQIESKAAIFNRKMRGLVLKSTGSFYQVQVEGAIMECRIKGKFRTKGIVTTNPVSVGDWVILDEEQDGRGIITDIEPRKNYIIRKSTNLSKQAHIVASNIDRAFLIVTLVAPETSFGFIDRFLICCEAFDVPVVIVFNKIDQYADESLEAIQQIMDYYTSIGYTCLTTSAIDGTNIEQLASMMTGKVCLLSGNSGVGKSSLLNAVYPEIDVRVGDISSSHQKGQHTTTFAEMFPLPDGGFLVDTPGIKGFGIIDIEKDELALYFPEMKDLLSNCKFYNCKHLNEPGCAVKEAVEEGQIADWRYQSYLSLMNDDEGPYR